jgi:cytochrome c-type biogenesis protein CcmH
MKHTAVIIALILSLSSGFAIDTTTLSDPNLQERYRQLTHELRCMQCQNQSIADSPVGLAGDLRREVRELLLTGKTDQEIRDFMAARYGEFILFRPQMSWRNAWIWGAPVLLLVVGGIAMLRIVRQRAQLLKSDLD